MGQFRPGKLHVDYLPGVAHAALRVPRRYTLTHSDLTGDLFLSIGSDYNYKQISGLYTRFMRDEVLAEWKENGEGMSLHVYCHVSGGLILGRAGWRESIFRSEMPLVLEAIRYGDRELFEANSELELSRIFVHFQSSRRNASRIEAWGTLADFRG